MANHWKYVIVAIVAFLIGSAAVASASQIQRFVIRDEGGDEARVTKKGKLQVNTTGKVKVTNLRKIQKVKVTNLPEIQQVEIEPPGTAVNLRTGRVNDILPFVGPPLVSFNLERIPACGLFGCTEPHIGPIDGFSTCNRDLGGFNYTVGAGHSLLITDIVAMEDPVGPLLSDLIQFMFGLPELDETFLSGRRAFLWTHTGDSDERVIIEMPLPEDGSATVIQLNTPLVVDAGRTLCPAATWPATIFLSGRVVDAQ